MTENTRRDGHRRHKINVCHDKHDGNGNRPSDFFLFVVAAPVAPMGRLQVLTIYCTSNVLMIVNVMMIRQFHIFYLVIGRELMELMIHISTVSLVEKN